MSLIYEGGATQGASQLSQALAMGTQQKPEAYKVDVSAEGGEGLWNIAQDVHKKLQTQEMRDANSVDEIFLKLRQDAVEKRGFQAGSDDGRIPGQYQGNKTQGRDLDLIYAKDKFSVQLDRPEGVPTLTGNHETKYKTWESNPQLQTDWNNFAAKNPTVLQGLDEGQQLEVMDSFEKAHGNKKVEDFQNLVGAKEFQGLDNDVKVKVLQLSKTDADGSRDALSIIKDPGFGALKGQKVLSRDGKDERPAQHVILERATGDKTLRTSMVNALNGKEGFEGLPAEFSPERRGQALAFMAMYAGREKGYAKWGDGGDMDAGAKTNAAKNLWNNVLSEGKFWEQPQNTAHAEVMFNRIQDWVDQSGYRKADYKPTFA